jgi:hypothetical protein
MFLYNLLRGLIAFTNFERAKMRNAIPDTGDGQGKKHRRAGTGYYPPGLTKAGRQLRLALLRRIEQQAEQSGFA